MGSAPGVINVSKALTVSSDNYFNAIGIDLWNDRGTEPGKTALQGVARSPAMAGYLIPALTCRGSRPG